MIELHISAESIKRSKNGSITGVLFLIVNNSIFPEKGWNDLIVVVLGFWLEELLKTDNLTSPGNFHFMDGSVRFQIKKDDSCTELTGFYQDKIVLKETIDYPSFRNSILETSSNVIRILGEKKLRNHDVDLLTRQLDFINSQR